MHGHNVQPRSLQTLDATLAPVRRTIVDDQKHSFRAAIRFLAHNLIHKTIKCLDTGFDLATAKDPGASYIPSCQIGQRSLALILVFDTHTLFRSRGNDRMLTTSGLNTGLLVGGNHVFIVTQRLALPDTLIKVKDTPRLFFQVGIPRKDPAPMLPRTNSILAEPPPDSGAADLSSNSTTYNLARYLGVTESRQWNAAFPGQLASERFYLHLNHRGKRRADARVLADLQVQPFAPQRNACATSRQPAEAIRALSLSPHCRCLAPREELSSLSRRNNTMPYIFARPIRAASSRPATTRSHRDFSLAYAPPVGGYYTKNTTQYQRLYVTVFVNERT